jgi:hypothetical protein
MMGDRKVQQDALFYEFSLERHVPETHLPRAIDRFVELDSIRAHLAPYYSEMGRPSIDPELLIRMLIVGYCFGVRSEPPRERARPGACIGSTRSIPAQPSKHRVQRSTVAVCCAPML